MQLSRNKNCDFFGLMQIKKYGKKIKQKMDKKVETYWHNPWNQQFLTISAVEPYLNS